MTQRNDSDGAKGGWRRKYHIYIVAAVLAIIMTMYVAPIIYNGDAMAGTLKSGQVLFVIKQNYWPNRGNPPVGQVVVLKKQTGSTIASINVIARIAGVPGDTIAIRYGKVYRNGKEFRPQDDRVSAGKNMTVRLGTYNVFILADNRASALDSRNPELGPVMMGNILGNVKFVLWPISDFGSVK